MPSNIQVRYEPESDPSVTFDENGTPFLRFGQLAGYGMGWTLYYLIDPAIPTAGVDTYFIPGDLTDVDRVVELAQAHLDILAGDA
jgi:hypothetical protein